MGWITAISSGLRSSIALAPPHRPLFYSLPSLARVTLTIALRVRTVFPYEAQRDQDLSFVENVVIEAHPAKDPMGAWWYGTLVKEGKKGWFPSAYIEEMSRKSTTN
jgi:hypothetical protein